MYPPPWEKRFLLTDQSSCRCLTLHTEDVATHERLPSLEAERDGNRSDAVHTEARDRDKSAGAEVAWGCTSVSLGGGGGQDQEGVGTGGGGCLPEDGAPSLLCPDTVGVGLSQQQLTEVVVLHVPCGSSEVLHTVSRGPVVSGLGPRFRCFSL